MDYRRVLYIVCIFIIVLTKQNILFANTGMPQLDPRFWLSQIFWLTITFVVIYFFISKIFSPKISKVIQDRKDLIEKCINDANSIKNEIQSLDNEYKKIIDNAYSEARKKSDKLKSELNQNLNVKRTTLEKEINDKVKDVEKELIIFKQETLKNFSTIISDISSNLLEKLLKIKIEKNKIEKSVKNILERQKNTINV